MTQDTKETKEKKAEAKPMQARIKDDFPMKRMRAMVGREFVKVEWRDVPEGLEEEAARTDGLEVREKPAGDDPQAASPAAKTATSDSEHKTAPFGGSSAKDKNK